jgi:hypothetical protein
MSICVVYIVYKFDSVERFRRFLISYRVYPSGMAHDLLVVFKCFNNDEELSEYKSILGDIPYKSINLNIGLDINSYFEITKYFGHEYFCYLNSSSIILGSDWLLKLYNHISLPDVGLVGVMGSYESLKFDFCDPFPNYHIRSVGFMLSRENMSSLYTQPILNKDDAYRFESGKTGLTKTILSKNLKVLVVGKNGIGYEKENWWESNTFRSGEQENLLIGDKHSFLYLDSDEDTRRRLNRLTWVDGINI